MPASFESRKQKLLATLSTPDDQYSDLSPKGSVDAGIRDLIAEINALPEYVTTSSCAGRVAVYLEGGGKGAKGGGKWLFTSHVNVDVGGENVDGDLFRLFGLGAEAPSATASPPDVGTARDQAANPNANTQILHILTSSLPAAQHAASAALQAGFRESGINRILDAKDQAHSPATPMVAVRSSGLAFDCIVGYEEAPAAESDPDAARIIRPMVAEQYLRTLIGVANQRFVTNSQRTGRFRQALLRKQ
ncbi:hypothetical protein LTR08_008163 [Meristemomyces frigidus]|nr:hypothetical protein LTR08_008163 [Meristemomyces frigidus]